MKQNEFKETEIGLIPEDWEVETIGDSSVDIIDGDRGVNYPKKTEFEKEGFCLFLNTKNVPGERFELSESVFIDKQKDEILRKGKLQRGDLVLTTRGSLGNVAYYNDIVPYEHVRINSGMVIVRDLEKTFDTYFLYLLLRSPLLKRQYFSFATGSAQPQLPIRDIKKIKLAVPPLAEQKAIAKILSGLDSKIEFNNKTNKTLEAIGQALFKHWFFDFEFPNNEGKPHKSSGGEMVDSELGDIPEGWFVGPLGDIMDVASGRRPGNKSDRRDSHFCIPLIGASSVMGYVKESLCAERVLVIGRVGTHGIVHRITPPSFPSDNTLIIKSKFYEYTYQILKIIDYNSLNVGTTQPLITQSSIKNLRAAIPPESILEEFERTVSLLFSKVNDNNDETETLSDIRDSLLPHLMSGRIRVKDLINKSNG